MSRSRRKTPITGWTKAASEKQDKRHANRRYRRGQTQQLRQHWADEDLLLKDQREVSSRWSFAKDGKQWFDPNIEAQWLRK